MSPDRVVRKSRTIDLSQFCLYLRDPLTPLLYSGQQSFSTSWERDSTPAQTPDLHLRNRIQMFGVNYTHRLVLKAGLYVYEQFLEDETIENPAGDILLFEPVFVAPEHVVSHCRSWLAYEGDKICSCGDTNRSGSTRIRAVHEVTVLEGLGPGAHVENTLSARPPLTSSGHTSYPFRLGRRFRCAASSLVRGDQCSNTGPRTRCPFPADHRGLRGGNHPPLSAAFRRPPRRVPDSPATPR